MGDWVETRLRFFDCLGKLQVFLKLRLIANFNF